MNHQEKSPASLDKAEEAHEAEDVQNEYSVSTTHLDNYVLDDDSKILNLHAIGRDRRPLRGASAIPHSKTRNARLESNS